MRTARALALGALLLPAAAAAQPALALRLGWAASFGDAAASEPMSQGVRSQLPLQADALWRFGPLTAGVYGSWGPGLTACDPEARCTASSVRVGIEATWTFRVGMRVLPWVGAGAGYEWTTFRRERAGSEVEWAYRGPELLSLQGGADFPVHRRVGVGPFVLVALGRYSTLSLTTPVESTTAEIAAKALHAWLEIGVRGTFDL